MTKQDNDVNDKRV